jgi:lipopolysaccharide export system protein LptC
MEHRSDTHTKLVRLAKFALPLVAIGLFASLFIYSKTNDIRDGLVFADEELRKLASEAKITNPEFSGVTSAGDAFSVSATVAQPDAPKPGRIDLENPSTTINFAYGVDLDASAELGSLNIKTNIAELSGRVSFETSNGYRATAGAITLNFRTGNVDGTGQILAEGPIGRIEAGEMHLIQNLNENRSGGNAVLIFKNQVRVIYMPDTANNQR